MKNNVLYTLLTFIVLLFSPFSPLHAATINVTNMDGPNEGFNDLTPFTPVGGNSATTLGQARLLAFQEAARRLSTMFPSTVPIEVQATFDPMGGNAGSATIGSAGPATVNRDFTGALRANTFYPIALANKLAGVDTDPATHDITAQFNSDIDGAVVLGASTFYYGFDANPPAGDLDLMGTLLHELLHGLGFISYVDLATGTKLVTGIDDIFSVNLEHHGALPALYMDMNDQQRVTASTAGPNLHYTGANVVAAAGGHVEMFAPMPQEAGSSVSHFSTSLTPNQLMEPFDTGPNHDIGLAAQLMSDIGWGVIPTISASLNSNAFTVGQTHTLSTASTAGGDTSLYDEYVVLVLPDQSILSMQSNASFATGFSPRLTNQTPITTASGTLFTYTFSGAEPIGTYTWYVAYTVPGTLTVVGSLRPVQFTFN